MCNQIKKNMKKFPKNYVDYAKLVLKLKMTKQIKEFLRIYVLY